MRESEGIYNEELADLDLNSIRQSLSLKMLPTDSQERVRLEFDYMGNGTPDESRLVQLLADDLTKFLLSSHAGKLEPRGSVALANVDEQISQLEWLAVQIESDLATVRNSVSQLGARNASPFQHASHQAKASPTLDSISETIDSIDLGTFRTHLNELKTNVAYAELGRTNHLQPTGVTNIEPVGAVPRVADLIWIGLFSVLAGSIVSVNYQPFTARGFENVSQVAAILRVPVLTALPAISKSGSAANDSNQQPERLPLANRVVGLARLLLFGLIVLTIGFCLINEGVRTAFLENPFHGFARMAWMFTGH